MRLIPIKEYSRIIEVLPILCVDVAVQNSKGEYLLVRRTNEPLKGKWWVVGGGVLKGETLEQAAIRKVKEEIGLKVKAAQPIGYYENTFKGSSINPIVPFHAVSIVFIVTIDNDVKIRLDTQSSEWKFAKKLPLAFRVKKFVNG